MLLQLSIKNGLERVKRDETTKRLICESRGIRSFRPSRTHVISMYIHVGVQLEIGLIWISCE